MNSATRNKVLDRDRCKCRRCGVDITHRMYSIHHRKPRGMGGTKDPRADSPGNLLTLCGTGTTGCHGWVESHRAEAYAQGWLVRSYDDLATVPVDGVDQ